METKKPDYERMWRELKTHLRNAIDMHKRLAKEDLHYRDNAFLAKDDLDTACNYDRLLVLMKDAEKKAAAAAAPAEEGDEDYDPTPIEDLNFTTRTYNCLHRAGKHRVGDLLKMSYMDLLTIRNLGRHSANEVREKLKAMGLELKEDLA